MITTQNSAELTEAAARAMLAALKEIEKGQGAYNRDPLTHAWNTIDDMKELARAAIAQAKAAGIEVQS
jgi:hypothetical protein